MDVVIQPFLFIILLLYCALCTKAFIKIIKIIKFIDKR